MSLICGASIPTFEWGVKYWKDHYKELAWKTSISDTQVCDQFVYSLSYDDEELAKELGSMSEEEL